SLYRDLQDRQGVASSLQGMASVAAADGEAARAATLCGAADALRTALGVQLPAASRAKFDEALAVARAALGEDEFTAAWAAGQALSLEEAVAEALSDVTSA
ncbi:MAG: ATP-binding protein, partial [Dehalococcoidia bacterium]